MSQYDTVKRDERGAIVIEATISLTAFIFAVFTILSVVNICYIQSRISMALDSAAKEISQYTYLYYMFDLNDLQAGWSEDTEDERSMAQGTIDDISGLMETLNAGKDEITETPDSFDAEVFLEEVQSDVSTLSDRGKEIADKIAEDPKEFIFAMAKLAGTELAEQAKVLLGEVLAEVFMKKNLVAYEGDDPDAFLKRNRVVNGLEGLDFNYSSLMAYGTTDKIQLVCTYDVKVIQLLNIDVTFTFRHCAQTISWGNGVSAIVDEEITAEESVGADTSIWKTKTATERGKYIVAQEQKNYKYVKTGTGNGFDAYDPDSNQFISIVTIDSFTKSYSNDASKITKKINSSYSSVKSGASKIGEKVNVKIYDETEKQYISSEPLESDASTRKYKIVVVFPENIPEETKNEVISSCTSASFKTKYPDCTVEIKTGYGDAYIPEEATETPAE